MNDFMVIRASRPEARDFPEDQANAVNAYIAAQMMRGISKLSSSLRCAEKNSDNVASDKANKAAAA